MIGVVSGNQPPPELETIEEVPNYQYFNQVFVIKLNLVGCPHINVEILGTKVVALLDSGAGISVISSLDLLKRWDLKIQRINLRAHTASGEKLNCLGFVNLPITFDSNSNHTRCNQRFNLRI